MSAAPDNRVRDLDHATKLSVARQLIDDLWKGAEGCAIKEDDLRTIGHKLFAWERDLRAGVVLRARRGG